MIISEVFYAVQSEGMLAGLPAGFVVTNDGPARRCWCGEAEGSWSPDRGMMLGGLLSVVRRYWSDYAVITGGEPLSVEGVEEVAAGLRRCQLHVTIETSGTVFTPDVPCDLMSINVILHRPVIAPKKTKTPAPAKYDVEVIRQLIQAYDCQLKFKVSDRTELAEIAELVNATGANRSRVFLMPAGTKPKELKEQTEWLPGSSRHFRYRFLPRLGVPAAPKKTGPA